MRMRAAPTRAMIALRVHSLGGTVHAPVNKVGEKTQAHAQDNLLDARKHWPVPPQLDQNWNLNRHPTLLVEKKECLNRGLKLSTESQTEGRVTDK